MRVRTSSGFGNRQRSRLKRIKQIAAQDTRKPSELPKMPSGYDARLWVADKDDSNKLHNKATGAVYLLNGARHDYVV